MGVLKFCTYNREERAYDLCSWAPAKPTSAVAHFEHCFGLPGQRHVVYSDRKAEGVCEEYRSVHWVHRAVSNVEQCSRVVKAQVAARKSNRNT